VSDYSELKRLADNLLAIGHREDFGVWITALEAFEKAASPEAVLALLAENEALRGLYRMHKMTETRAMRDMKSERDQLKAEVETLRALPRIVANEYSQLLMPETLSATKAEKFQQRMNAAMEIDRRMSKEAVNV
jgi:hypothetical protein